MPTIANLVAKITADASGFRRGAGDVGKSLTSMERGAQGASSGFSKLQAAIVTANQAVQLGVTLYRGFRAVVDTVADSLGSAIQAANEQENATAKLNAALRASDQFTAEYSNELQRLASQYQNVTTFGDDAVLGVESLLVSMGATRDQVPEATKAVLDLASGLRTDLHSAALLVGKAIAGDFGTLKRYGIFVEEGASKTEKLAQALDEINRKFGGQAAAQADTFAGLVARMANAFGDLQEEIGFVITQSPALRGVLDSARQGFADLSGFVLENRDRFTELVDKGVKLAIEAIGTLVKRAREIAGSFGLETLLPAFDALQRAIGGIADNVAESTEVVEMEFRKIDGVWRQVRTEIEAAPLAPAADTAPVVASFEALKADVITILAEAGKEAGSALAREAASAIFGDLIAALRDLPSAILGGLDRIAPDITAPPAPPTTIPQSALRPGQPPRPTLAPSVIVGGQAVPISDFTFTLPDPGEITIPIFAEGSPRLPFTEYITDHVPKVLASVTPEAQRLFAGGISIVTSDFGSSIDELTASIVNAQKQIAELRSLTGGIDFLGRPVGIGELGAFITRSPGTELASQLQRDLQLRIEQAGTRIRALELASGDFFKSALQRQIEFQTDAFEAAQAETNERLQEQTERLGGLLEENAAAISRLASKFELTGFVSALDNVNRRRGATR